MPGTDDGHVWVTTDYATTWTRISDALPERWVTRIGVHPEDAATAYVTFSGLKWRDPQPHIFRTTDFGGTWQDISGDPSLSTSLPDAPINALAIDPEMPDTLFVGTDVGAFVSLDAGQSWDILGLGLPAVPVNDLKIHAETRTLVAGTHGRSMYSLSLLPPSVDTEPTTLPQPETLSLHSAYPNPFTTSTTIPFDLSQSGRGQGRHIRYAGETSKNLAQRAPTNGSTSYQLEWKRPVRFCSASRNVFNHN